MNINDAFQSKYLKASDIEKMRLPVIVRIADVVQEIIGEDRKSKAVVYFDNREKGVVLNKENAERLVRITGSIHTEDWVRCEVGLTIEQTKYKGTPVPALRFVAPIRGGQTRDSRDALDQRRAERPAEPRRDSGWTRVDDTRGAPRRGPVDDSSTRRTRHDPRPDDDVPASNDYDDHDGHGDGDDDIPFAWLMPLLLPVLGYAMTAARVVSA